ncbi:MAG TPA: hypothetical protein DDW87_13060 [Firmicutes bacterium]|nr:hypothetical protein [Bacillota bacterium]
MYTVTYLPYITAIVLTALVVILIISLRWFRHKEHMAVIDQGLVPKDERRNGEQHKRTLSAGLILSLTGLALTIGLITLGVGPWLLIGLLPLFIGLAFILVSLVMTPGKPKETKLEPKVEPRWEIKPEPQPVAASVEVVEDEEEDDEEGEEEEKKDGVRTFSFTEDDMM